MLIKTTEHDVLLIHQKDVTWKWQDRKKVFSASVLGENANGQLFNLHYVTANKNKLDWMHPNEITAYRKQKVKNDHLH